MKTIIDKLDSVYLNEEKDCQYDAYTEFDRITREHGVAMADYIIEFEWKYNKLRNFGMILPDAVLAFKLLDTAGLDVKDKQLALTACSTLTFSDMRSALKRIFGENHVHGSHSKDDSAYFTDFSKKNNKPRPQKQSRMQPGTNPIDKYGRRSKCAICQSTFHWAKDCPHRSEQARIAEDLEQCNITLFSGDTLSDSEIFMVESLGSAVIDTACTKTVCGQKWLDHYISGLKPAEQKKLECTDSAKAFKFGDGRVVQSAQKVKIPAKIGQTNCHIETEVVPADIPLLLSKTSLKRVGAVLDLQNDKAIMFKHPVTLELTFSGHYCVNLQQKDLPCDVEKCSEDEVLMVTENMSPKEKKRVLLKLHKQFGHASVDRLEKLLASSGNYDDECIRILKNIVDSCETCVSAGSIVTTKKASEIVKIFIHCWISTHGPPKRLFSDNGGEFNNEEMRDMAEKFNIEVKTTAAYSPWSNGLLEIHNQTLTEILLKVTGDKVYYKHVDSAQWKGPGVVIGQDGAVIFVRHGGSYVRVHHSRLRKTDDNHTVQEEGEKQGQNSVDNKTVQAPEPSQISDDSDTDIVENSPVSKEREVGEQYGTLPQPLEEVRNQCPRLKAGQTITYTDRESGESRTAQILGRAGKVTGMHKDWYNLQYTHPEVVAGITGSADLTQLDDLQVISLDMTVTNSNQQESDVYIIENETFVAAKKNELDNWKRNRVFNEVKDDGQKCISTRWGRELNRNVYIRPPPEAQSGGILWKLNKCVYGLADTSLYWYNKVKDTMQQLGGRVSKIDPAVFYWLDDSSELIEILASHVDDFLWGGSEMFSSTVIPHLKAAFQVGHEEHNSFSYVGMEISSVHGEIHVHQSMYIKGLQPIVIDPARAVQREAPLTDSETDILRSKIGQILWTARQS
ncbi:hypothetical protein QQF64_000471 [Cirrhinus molitorella]|uniref:Integrase catalytic domain-containing protein n=1 Tax=Cirrhinus molitorella TaxID=172907 RepID=A0ABR3NXB1_9TELE